MSLVCHKVPASSTCTLMKENKWKIVTVEPCWQVLSLQVTACEKSVKKKQHPTVKVDGLTCLSLSKRVLSPCNAMWLFCSPQLWQCQAESRLAAWGGESRQGEFSRSLKICCLHQDYRLDEVYVDRDAKDQPINSTTGEMEISPLLAVESWMVVHAKSYMLPIIQLPLQEC